jgi:hypothetical protein
MLIYIPNGDYDMIDLPVCEYDVEAAHNNEKAEALMKTLFPNLKTSYEFVYQIASYLEETGVNPQVLPRVIRSVHNILIGTGVGHVIVHVNKTALNVSTRETDTEIKAQI